MALLDHFNLVYGTDARILDPSVEVHAATGVGPQFQLETGHTMRWIGAFEGSKSVVADRQSIAFRGHKTETMIPHLPIPPWPLGVPWLKTVMVDSKCHIYCHNPDVQVEGKQVGIAMLLLAPPFHCASIQLPASLNGLAKILDRVPAVSKMKAALGRLHQINEKLAKLDELGKKAQQVIEGARVAQILGTAALEAYHKAQELWQDDQDLSKAPPEQNPFHVSQELLRADADYRSAAIAIEKSGKPGVEYYKRAQELDALERDMHERDLQTRSKFHRSDRNKEELDQLESQRHRIGAQRASHQERADALRNRIARLHRRARLGLQSPGLEGLKVQANQVSRNLDALKAKHQALDCAHQAIEQNQRNLQQDIARDRAQSKRDTQHCKLLKQAMDSSLADMPSAPATKQLSVMLPSLTSFSATFFLHSVKIGMSPASYWGMQLKVLAIVMSDLIDYGIGLVGDALLVDGPASRVGSWVAELGAGALQGMAGSGLRAWGSLDCLDFSVPIKTGSLVAGGLIQGRAEFYWRADDQTQASSAYRSGLDLPGQDHDCVQVLQPEAQPGIDFEIPKVW